MNVRNVLGLRHQDDWIFNLNIGNVMHLSAMNIDELSPSLENTHELNKDAMLEKIILISVSLFCVGTELRFLAAANANEVKSSSTNSIPSESNEPPNPYKKFTKKDSETLHGKALRVASIFLPSECPLVGHVISSYIKHHLKPKVRKGFNSQLERKKEDAENKKTLMTPVIEKKEQNKVEEKGDV